MSENNLSISNRQPLQTAASLQPSGAPGSGSVNRQDGNRLPPQAETGTGVTALEPVSEAVRQASRSPATGPSGESSEPLDQAVTQMNEFVQSTQRDLRFNIDEETGQTVVKVIDRQSEEVIRQIPDEIFLKLARHLKESQDQGLDDPVHLFNERA